MAKPFVHSNHSAASKVQTGKTEIKEEKNAKTANSSSRSRYVAKTSQGARITQGLDLRGILQTKR